MGYKTGVEWTSHTWNPWRGCSKLSEGCQKCYWFRDANRYGYSPTEVVRSKTTFQDPLKWKEPSFIFACSWSDFFHNEADGWRNEAWEIIRNTPHHTYQILTKRPENILTRLPSDWDVGYENVWLGVSVENKKHGIPRISILRSVPAQLRFLSVEPLLEDVADELDLAGIHWVVVGGESDYTNPRPMKPEWALNAIEKCKTANVPVFLKQLGGSKKINGHWGGNSINGKTWTQMPNEGDI